MEQTEQRFAASLELAAPESERNLDQPIRLDADRILKEGALIRRATAAAQALQQAAQPAGAWRQQLAGKVRAHRARRGGEEGSLALTFEDEPMSDPGAETSAGDGPLPQHQLEEEQRLRESIEQIPLESIIDLERQRDDASARMDRATLDAENDWSAESTAQAAAPAPPVFSEPQAPGAYQRVLVRAANPNLAPGESGKLIHFPAPRNEQPTFEQQLIDELAEPLPSSPRILDAPESMDDLPLFAPPVAVVHLDDVHLGEQPLQQPWHPEETATDFELPLQVAAMQSRFTACVMDLLLVAIATAIFAVTVLLASHFSIHGKGALALAALLPATLWTAYHYLFLVYSGSTPGMQMAQLKICSFDGDTPARALRAGRALSLLVSCMSLGMGFAWAFVDEDRLGWHDRISGTYLRSM